MDNMNVEKIKGYANNSALVIQLLALPMIGMFVMLMASNKIVSSDIAKQLNITFIQTAVVAYTHVIIPCVSLITTVKDLLKFNDVEQEMVRMVVSSITVFVTVAIIFCNFQLSLGVEVIDMETCIYYTATSMIEFIAISFFIFGVYLLGTKILDVLKYNKDKQ